MKSMTGRTGAGVAALTVSALFAASCGGASNAATPATRLDLSAYEVAFEDEFDALNVSGRRCDSRWIAHTPWNGDFGFADFTDPSRGFPFTTKDGILRIEAKKDADGKWRSGLLSGYNTCDEGFAQQYGYFEIRAKLPAGDGFWPAFWLIGVDRSRYTAELDVFEHHGGRPDRFTATIHVHPRAEGVQRINVHHAHEAAPGQLTSEFNTYGVSVDADDTIIYFNREEIWRTKTPEEYKQPLYMLLNLAMDEGFVTASTPDKAVMEVDYVRVFRRKP